MAAGFSAVGTKCLPNCCLEKFKPSNGSSICCAFMSHGRDFCKSDHNDLLDLMAEVSQKKNGKQMPPWQGSFHVPILEQLSCLMEPKLSGHLSCCSGLHSASMSRAFAEKRKPGRKERPSAKYILATFVEAQRPLSNAASMDPVR